MELAATSPHPRNSASTHSIGNKIFFRSSRGNLALNQLGEEAKTEQNLRDFSGTRGIRNTHLTDKSEEGRKRRGRVPLRAYRIITGQSHRVSPRIALVRVSRARKTRHYAGRHATFLRSREKKGREFSTLFLDQ